MAKKSRRKPGPPARYSYRPTLTIRLTAPVYETVKKAAAKHGKSLSEEIEDMLTACGDLETAQRQLEDMRANTAKMHSMAASILEDAGEIRSAARHDLRAAGYLILREITGQPTSAVIKIEGSLSPEEVARALGEISEIKRRIEEAEAAKLGTAASDTPEEARAADTRDEAASGCG